MGEVDLTVRDKDGDLSSVSGDDELLAKMGKKAELKRVYGFWTLCAYNVMMMCSWSCLVVLYSSIFDLGGPMALVWGTLIVAVGQTLLMMSLAEFCSIWPTAGGQQYYTQMLASPKTRAALSYLVGWAVLVGEISTGSSCALNSAQIIQSFVEITHPGYNWPQWLTWIVYSVFLIGPIVVNFAPRWLPALNVFGAFWCIAGGIAWAVSFAVLAPKHDTSFVFTTFINNSGYKNAAWVFILSFYSPIYGLYGTDGMMHLVEEMKNASRDAPRVMMWSMIFASVTSWLTAILMMYCAGDYETYMQATQPYMNWFIDILGSTYGGGVFCALVMMGLNFFIIVGTNLAGSRLVWSMARDRAFPFSEYLAKITHGIPLRAMLCILVVDCIIGLIVLGSPYAMQAIISGGGVTLQIGYVTPVLMVLIRGRKVLPARPHFDLGRWGYPINCISVCWSFLVIVMYSFPMYIPVVGKDNIENMNWSCLIVGATVIFPGFWWFYKARHVYIKDSNSVMEDNTVIGAGSEPKVIETPPRTPSSQASTSREDLAVVEPVIPEKKD